jgi:glutamate dehydrogenase/leucine dehydrogenase
MTTRLDFESPLYEMALAQLDAVAARLKWREGEVTARLEEIMTRSLDRVWAVARKEGTDLRVAALMSGVGRVAEAHRARGLYP